MVAFWLPLSRDFSTGKPLSQGTRGVPQRNRRASPVRVCRGLHAHGSSSFHDYLACKTSHESSEIRPA
jgi:hypothetical protein